MQASANFDSVFEKGAVYIKLLGKWLLCRRHAVSESKKYYMSEANVFPGNNTDAFPGALCFRDECFFSCLEAQMHGSMPR